MNRQWKLEVYDYNYNRIDQPNIKLLHDGSSLISCHDVQVFREQLKSIDLPIGSYNIQVDSKEMKPQSREVNVTKFGMDEIFVLGTPDMLVLRTGKIDQPFIEKSHLVGFILKQTTNETKNQFYKLSSEVGLLTFQVEQKLASYEFIVFDRSNVTNEALSEFVRTNYDEHLEAYGAILSDVNENYWLLSNSFELKEKKDQDLSRFGFIETIYSDVTGQIRTGLKNISGNIAELTSVIRERLDTGLKPILYGSTSFSALSDPIINSHYAQHWHLFQAKVPEAWELLQSISPSPQGSVGDITFGSAEIIMSIVDSGVQSTGSPATAVLPAFQGNVTNGTSKVVKFVDFSTSSNSFPENNNTPDGSHGTNCAGIAAGKAETGGSNNPGGEAIIGVAPNVRLIAVQSFGSNKAAAGSGLYINNVWSANMGFPSRLSLNNALPPPLSPGLQNAISSNSWITKAYQSGTGDVMFYEITVYGRQGLGVVPVWGAGNSDIDTSIDNKLSANPAPIIVGATALKVSPSQKEVKATYSSYGSRLDITAPGGDSGDSTEGNTERHRIHTGSMVGGGDYIGSPLFNITINSVSNFGGDSTVAVNSTDGIYPGQYIAVGDPTIEGEFETKIVRSILSSTAFNCDKFYYGPSSGVTGGVIALHSTVSNYVSATEIQLANERGFRSGQKIYVGLPPNGEEVTIDSITVGANVSVILEAPGLSGSVSLGTPVIAGEIIADVTANIGTTGERYVDVTVDNAEGFFPGQTVELRGGSYRPFLTDVASVDVPNKIVSIVAPPQSILSTGLKMRGVGFGDYTSTFTGTSAATPFLSGVAALVLSANKNLSWLEVKEILQYTADRLELNLPHSNGGWENGKGERVFVNNNNMEQVKDSGGVDDLERQLLLDATQGTKIIKVQDAVEYKVNHAIEIRSSALSKEYNLVQKIDAVNNELHLQNPVGTTRTAGDVVRGGRYALHSDLYGAGRVNAKRAVEAAIAYTHNERDFLIRDTLTDDGTVATNPSTIDSPDIWARNTHPDSDTGAQPASYSISGDGFHEYPSYDQTRWIYVRLKNRGTDFSTLKQSRIVVSITNTDQAGTAQFPFPEAWYSLSENSPNIQDTTIITPEPLGSAFTMSDLPTLTNNQGQTYKDPEPHILEEVLPGEDITVIIPWSKLDRPRVNSGLRTFIKVHIAPFDGPVQGLEVHENNNLTYKEVSFSGLVFTDSTGEIFDSPLDVPQGGLSNDIAFNLIIFKLIDTAVDNITITATLKFSNSNPDSVVSFSKTGGTWQFNTTPTWINLSDPTVGALDSQNRQDVDFAGDLILDDTHAKVTFDVVATVGGSPVFSRTVEMPVKVQLSLPTNGISQKTTTVHTFTDMDLLPPQTGNEDFGAVVGALNTEYRTWSAFTGVLNSAPSLKAYAMFEGEFFIQEIPTTDLINLIIKVEDQPTVTYGKIKYIVYRGLKQSSFFNNNAVRDIIADAPGTNSDLLNRMWAVRSNLNIELGTPGVNLERDDFGETAVGSPLPGSTTVEEVFNSNTFQRIAAGWTIGEFETNGLYGIQFIVDEQYRSLDLDDLRVLDHKITISYDPSQPQFGNGQEEGIKTKLKREEILSYWDPVAHCGMMPNGEFIVHKSTGDEIVYGLHERLPEYMSKFSSFQNVYFDFRNELNNSLNLYGNYGDGSNLNVAKFQFEDASATTVIKEYHDGNGWPIIVMTPADFPSVATSALPVKFALPVGDNTDPILFLSGAVFNPAYASGKYKIPTPGSSYTDVFELFIFNDSGTAQPSASAVKLQYARRYDTSSLPPLPATLTRPYKNEYIDNLMSFTNVSVFEIAGKATWNTAEDVKYIGWSSIGSGVDFTFRSGLAKDDLGNIIFGFIDGIGEKGGSSAPASTQASLDLRMGENISESFYLAMRERRLVTLSPFDLVGPSVKTIQVDSTNNNYAIDILGKSFDDAVTLAYTDAEEANITGARSTFLSGAPVHIIAISHTTGSSNGSPYTILELGVQGIEYNPTTFQYEIKRITTGLTFYSLDGRNFFTDSYAVALEPLI